MTDEKNNTYLAEGIGHWALCIVDCGEKFLNHWLKKAIDIEEEK